jgi:hypothetical protein
VVICLPDEQSAHALAGTERLRRLFRFFAATQCRGRSLVYETLSQGVADDDALLGPAHRDDSLLAMADSYLRWLAPARHAADDFQWLPANPDSN